VLLSRDKYSAVFEKEIEKLNTSLTNMSAYKKYVKLEVKRMYGELI
jgi:hypothetical protein